MKKIYNLLFISLAVVLYAACTPEEDDLFDQSSANRISAALQEYKDILTSAPNGWLMQYYPSSTQKFGGYNVLVSFATDGSTTIASDCFNPDDKAVSTYALKQSAGPVLTFNTYNEIMHFFSDPLNPAGVGNKGKGMEGDFEFTMMDVSKDKIVMEGKKRGSRVIMTPLPQGASWKDYISQIQNAEADMLFGSYKYTAGNINADVTVSYRVLTMEYMENGVNVTKQVPYIVTPTGFRLYNPLEIGGVTVDELTYKGESENYKFTSADGKGVLKGVVLPLNEALTSSSNWFFSYSGLGDMGKAYWNLAKASLLAQEGERMIYMYYTGGKSLTFRSGNYIGTFNCTYELEGEDKITIALASFADSNAQYYYTKVPNFPGFVDILQGTFTLKADNMRTPTWIELQDVNKPANKIRLSKNQINYPADN